MWYVTSKLAWGTENSIIKAEDFYQIAFYNLWENEKECQQKSVSSGWHHASQHAAAQCRGAAAHTQGACMQGDRHSDSKCRPGLK